MTRSTLAVLVGVLVVLGARPARADDRAAAERYFRAGAKAYAGQSFGAAVANFDEAYRALPLPEIAFSAAQAYRRLYRIEPRPAYVQRAVELYRVYLDQVKTGGRVSDAADSLGEMERELDRLKVRGAPISTPVIERTRLGINVSLGAPAAEAAALREIGDATGEQLADVAITMDGKPIEPFALLDVAPGEHAIAVSADGYFPIEKQQHAVKGASAVVELELVPRPATVTIDTERGARIAIDGRGMVSPRLELAAGKHVLTITRRGREPVGRELVVARGQELVVAAPLRKTARRRAVPWVLGGAGLLAAGSLIATTGAIIENGRAADLRDALDRGNQLPADGDRYDRAVRHRDELRTSAFVLGAGALAAGATGLLLYLFDTPSSERLAISPIATATTGGIAASRRF